MGFLHISDRLLAGELSRVEAARGTLYPLAISMLLTVTDNDKKDAFLAITSCSLFVVITSNLAVKG